MAGIPVDVPMETVNRFCSSGLEAVALIAAKIKSGMIEVGIGAGCESMTLSDMGSLVKPEELSDAFLEDPKAPDCLLPMGVCSEVLSKQYKQKRLDLDKFALLS